MATLIFAGEDVHQLTSERQEHVSRLTQMLKTSSAESRDLTQSEKREWDLSMNEITHLSEKILRLRAEYPDLPETPSRNTAIADMCRALYWTANGQNDKRFPTTFTRMLFYLKILLCLAQRQPSRTRVSPRSFS